MALAYLAVGLLYMLYSGNPQVLGEAEQNMWFLIIEVKKKVTIRVIRLIRLDDGTIKTEKIPDNITVNLEKQGGEWVIKK